MRFLFIFLAFFVAKAAFSQAVLVPAVGSVWKSRLTYKETGHQKAVETITVTRLEEGRPVFSGEVFGYKGEILESSSGTVVYTDACKSQLPQDLLTPPPAVPNQCGFHLCNPPPMGETFKRRFIVITDLFACEPQVGAYSFTPIRGEKLNGEEVIAGDASVFFSTLRRVHWRSYIKPGVGEVHGESSGRVTEYLEVSVQMATYNTGLSVPHEKKPTVSTLQMERVYPEKCDIVAFGDSLTEGMGASRNESYPAHLSALLGVNVCNFGVSGLTTDQALLMVGEVVAAQPKRVILVLGANDAFNGVNVSITKHNLKTILDQLKHSDIHVVVGGYEVNDPAAPEYVKKIANVHREVVEGREVVFIPNILKGVWGERGRISSDSVHPNAEGYKKIAETVHDEAFGALRVAPLLPANSR